MIFLFFFTIFFCALFSFVFVQNAWMQHMLMNESCAAARLLLSIYFSPTRPIFYMLDEFQSSSISLLII